jgi:hypothetical protein
MREKTDKRANKMSSLSRKFPGTPGLLGNFLDILGQQMMDSKHGRRYGRKPELACLQTAFGMEVAGGTLVAASPPRGIPGLGEQTQKQAR